jgi:hypothetical protein
MHKSESKKQENERVVLNFESYEQRGYVLKENFELDEEHMPINNVKLLVRQQPDRNKYINKVTATVLRELSEKYVNLVDLAMC